MPQWRVEWSQSNMQMYVTIEDCSQLECMHILQPEVNDF